MAAAVASVSRQQQPGQQQGQQPSGRYGSNGDAGDVGDVSSLSNPPTSRRPSFRAGKPPGLYDFDNADTSDQSASEALSECAVRAVSSHSYLRHVVFVLQCSTPHLRPCPPRRPRSGRQGSEWMKTGAPGEEDPNCKSNKRCYAISRPLLCPAPSTIRIYFKET
ncbi:hypothetical protein C0J52_26333 [Blattella germanica]|nr:hypothetical protein C0J52_26333 [Blattella germanica]